MLGGFAEECFISRKVCSKGSLLLKTDSYAVAMKSINFYVNNTAIER